MFVVWSVDSMRSLTDSGLEEIENRKIWENARYQKCIN